MTGAEHYKRAQALLDQVTIDDGFITVANYSGAGNVIAAAQVHATLALTAATAYPAIVAYCGDEADDSREWAKVLA